MFIWTLDHRHLYYSLSLHTIQLIRSVFCCVAATQWAATAWQLRGVEHQDRSSTSNTLFLFFFLRTTLLFFLFSSHTPICGVLVSNKILFVLEISFCFFLRIFLKKSLKKKNSSYEILNMLHNFIIIFLLLELWSALVW